MNKNARPGTGGTAQDGGMNAPALAPAPPPLAMSGGPATVPMQNSTPVMPSAPASSGLADLRNSGPGTAPSAYGTAPQDIVNAAYGPKLPSDRAGAGSAYGDLIAGATGAPATVPQQPGASPALAPPLTPPQPSGIDRIPNRV